MRINLNSFLLTLVSRAEVRRTVREILETVALLITCE